MVLHFIVSGETAYLREERFATSPDLCYFDLVLLYLCLDTALLGHILIILLDGLLHGEDLTFFTLELFEKHAKGSLL